MRNWNKIFWRDAIHSVVVGIFYSREIGCRSRSKYFIAAILPISTIFLLRLGTFRFNEMLLSPLYQTGSFERMHSSNSSNFHNSSCTIMMLFPFEYLPGSKVGGTSAEIWSNLLPLLLPSTRVSDRANENPTYSKILFKNYRDKKESLRFLYDSWPDQVAVSAKIQIQRTRIGERGSRSEYYIIKLGGK